MDRIISSDRPGRPSGHNSTQEPHPILFDCADAASAVAAALGGLSAVIVVADSTVVRLFPGFGDVLRSGLDMPVLVSEFEPGERAKTMDTVVGCCRAMAAGRFDRQCAVVGFGGGVATDLAGMISALWMRGVKLIQVPTSLLAMADAAIGGKAAVNIPEGRNLVGVLKMPDLAVIAPSFLATLPVPERISGLVEIVKTGFVGDPDLVSEFDSMPAEVDIDWLAGVARRAATTKMDIVSVDPGDSGIRLLLNFGHTVGHAIESVSRYSIGHGISVAAGMVAESAIGRSMGLVDEIEHRRLVEILNRVGVPPRPAVQPADLLQWMLRDKKNREGGIRIALPANDHRIPSMKSFTTVAVSERQFLECWDD